jgi:3-methyl-2-oxobutanoate hydroxymethyltransferase
MKRQRKLNLPELHRMKRDRTPVVWITAYDYPLALVAEQAGVDMILVGDSGGMVQLGYESTNPVTMDEMIVLARAARRGATKMFIVGDMPQGSYEVSDQDAVRNALRFVKEAGCDAVKLEGGHRIISRVQALADSGILVVGHLGLTPQSASSFGGYRVQGKTIESFEATMEEALALEAAGAAALLLEAMPSEPAGQIARALAIPVLGIGAGDRVDGQLAIIHDVLGFYQPFRPLFAKCYVPQVVERFRAHIAACGDLPMMGRKERRDGLLTLTEMAVEEYAAEVRAGQYPAPGHCYPIDSDEIDALRKSKHWIESERTVSG